MDAPTTRRHLVFFRGQRPDHDTQIAFGMLIWNQRQLHQVVAEYVTHYNTARPHRAVNAQRPAAAWTLTAVGPDTTTTAVERVDVLGGLIREYRRAA